MQQICGYGVAKVLESGRPEFKKDDLVWGLMGWEDCLCRSVRSK